MKTKEKIIEEMMQDSHWKIPDPEGLGIYGKEIVEKEREKFNKEVSRRLKIQQVRERNEYHKKSNQLYFVIDFLNDERDKLREHYEEDIHGIENWKSFEKMEKIDFVLPMLYALLNKLSDSHRNVQKEMDRKTEEVLEQSGVVLK